MVAELLDGRIPAEAKEERVRHCEGVLGRLCDQLVSPERVRASEARYVRAAGHGERRSARAADDEFSPGEPVELNLDGHLRVSGRRQRQSSRKLEYLCDVEQDFPDSNHGRAFGQVETR